MTTSLDITSFTVFTTLGKQTLLNKVNNLDSNILELNDFFVTNVLVLGGNSEILILINQSSVQFCIYSLRKSLIVRKFTEGNI